MAISIHDKMKQVCLILLLIIPIECILSQDMTIGETLDYINSYSGCSEDVHLKINSDGKLVSNSSIASPLDLDPNNIIKNNIHYVSLPVLVIAYNFENLFGLKVL